MYVCRCTCVCVDACEGQGTMFSVIPEAPSLCFSTQGISPAWNLPSRLGSWPESSKDQLVSAFPVLILQIYTTCLHFNMGSGIGGQSPCLQRVCDSLPVFLSLTMVLKVNWQNFAEWHIPATLVPDIITTHSQDGLASDRETQGKDGECSLAIARRMTLVRSAFMLTPR